MVVDEAEHGIPLFPVCQTHTRGATSSFHLEWGPWSVRAHSVSLHPDSDLYYCAYPFVSCKCFLVKSFSLPLAHINKRGHMCKAEECAGRVRVKTSYQLKCLFLCLGMKEQHMSCWVWLHVTFFCDSNDILTNLANYLHAFVIWPLKVNIKSPVTVPQVHRQVMLVPFWQLPA